LYLASSDSHASHTQIVTDIGKNKLKKIKVLFKAQLKFKQNG